MTTPARLLSCRYMAEATVTKTHRLPPKLAADLAALARREGTSENYEMTVALRAHIDASKRGQK